MMCADEVSFHWGRADVLCDNGKATYEIEVKTNKHDLFVNEIKKGGFWKKHDKYKNLDWKRLPPNYFMICVPEEMKELALEWIEKVNPKYGLILVENNVKFWPYHACDYIHIVRSAKKLHKEYRSKKQNIGKRLSSAYIFKWWHELDKSE